MSYGKCLECGINTNNKIDNDNTFKEYCSMKCLGNKPSNNTLVGTNNIIGSGANLNGGIMIGAKIGKNCKIRIGNGNRF